jgi:3-oxoacid CoA-transferase
MDLASGAKRLIITMTHTTREGASKIVPQITLPLTARNAVDTVITDIAVFKFIGGRLTLVEVMPGATLEQVRATTSVSFDMALT